MKYIKNLPVIDRSDFLSRVESVKEFESSSGRHYEVSSIVNNILFFIRVNANRTPWFMDLEQLYKAYAELEDFRREKFRSYIPLRHSPGRGLLLKLELIRPSISKQRTFNSCSSLC